MAELLADAVAVDVGIGQFTFTLVVTDGWVTMVPDCARWAEGRPITWVLRDLDRRRARYVVLLVPELWAHAMDLAELGVTGDVGPLIASRYPGRCRTCTGRWGPGDLIGFSEDEDAWICADCAA